MPDESADKSSLSMDEIAQRLRNLFCNAKLRFNPRWRYWVYDPERQLFYRDPVDLEAEKVMDDVLGIERHEEDNEPRGCRTLTSDNGPSRKQYGGAGIRYHLPRNGPQSGRSKPRSRSSARNHQADRLVQGRPRDISVISLCIDYLRLKAKRSETASR